MIRRDMPEVLRIEEDVFEFPWSEEDFIRCLRQRNCIGMVCENGDHEIVGFMIYELHKTRLHLLTFAVAQRHQRNGYGQEMVFKLTTKLSHHRRNSIFLEVRERNLDAQLFFRQMGFSAVEVIQGFYDDTPEDAYVMRYRHGEEPLPVLPVFGTNRISDYQNE